MSGDEFVVAVVNRDQAAAWNGDEGVEWAAHSDFYEGAERRHHARLMAAAAIKAGERVLDIGCGNGRAARDAAGAASPGSVVGIDLSGQMIAVARAAAAAEGLTNVSFIHGDAQVYPFGDHSFDVAISGFAAMFFGDQHAAFTNIGCALRPGGRLVMMSWQAPAANEWFSTIVRALTLDGDLPSPPPGAQGPFTHADPEWTSTLLADTGFVDIEFTSVEEPMYFGVDADEGFGRMSASLGWMMAGLDDSQRRQALDNLRTALTVHETADGVALGSAAWLITATATGARRGT